jgi:glycosyltransferase involved in cell wall biosynthesis
MKILLVIDSLGSGGAQSLFINVVNGLAARHDVTVFFYHYNSDFHSSDLVDTITVHRAKRSPRKGFSAKVLWQLIAQIRRCDVVVSFQITANIYCAMARLFALGTRQISCEMSIINETESPFRRFITNLANLMSSNVVCNSYSQTAYVASRFGMKRKATTIWSGCKEMVFAPRPPVNPRDHAMLVVGRIAYPKNGVRFLQALHLFHKKNGFIPRVSWAGRDDNSSELSVQMKQQMVEFLEVHPHVKERFHFLGEVSDVAALYAQSDTLVSPSIYEGMPVVICEAMLSGCPVIASRISDNTIALGEKQERGFLCDPLSPADICAAIERRLSATPEEIKQIVLRARTFATQEYLMDKMVEQYNNIIESVV